MKISVIMVVHNEEENVVKTLTSVYDWVNEIVIVDGNSSDKTVEKIRTFEIEKNQSQGTDKEKDTNVNPKKIRVFQEENLANFIINKQKALDKATCDWILELDADEIVSNVLKIEILTLLDNKNSLTNADQRGRDAYWIPRLNHFLNSPLRKGGQYPDYTIRLYKRVTARFPQLSIHDQVEINGKKTVKSNVTENDEIGKLQAPILHYPYKNVSAFFRKWSQYAMFEGDQLFAKGFRSNFTSAFSFLLFKPAKWFFLTYFRHKGFVDGSAGFLFSLFSGMRYWVEYMRVLELQKAQKPEA